jgi:hypothetical protein
VTALSVKRTVPLLIAGAFGVFVAYDWYWVALPSMFAAVLVQDWLFKELE